MAEEIIYISICIPSYQRPAYIKRLLESIASQSYKAYEVVISDDSPNEEIKNIVENTSGITNITYIKNNKSLGSPANWNNAIRHAKYDWIKIMHDDDYFSTENSLAQYAESIAKNPGINFFFSSYIHKEEQTQIEKYIKPGFFEKKLLRFTRNILFRNNLIGHPSTTIYRRNKQFEFDIRLKWVVDIEFYMRYLNTYTHFYHIDKELVTISSNETQITKQVFRNKEVEIPENHYLLNTIGYDNLRNIIVYDYFWRLYRNLKISHWEEIGTYGIQHNKILSSMIRFQNSIGNKVVNIGILSKGFMFMHYVWNYTKI